MAERLTEKELVERFGTEAQKKYFKEHGSLNYGYKQNLLNRASKYCSVKKLENGKYSLTKQKQVPVSVTGLYQYTCPLILDYIMNSGKEKVNISTVSLAEKTHIVSEYYRTIKSYPDQIAKKFHLNEDSIYDFIKNISDSLGYYIGQTLKYLKQMELVDYTNNHFVYEIWSMHPDKCQKYRNAFEQDNTKLILGLSKDFKTKLLDNASGRLKDNFDEVKFTYDFLTRVCIGNSRVGKRIVDKIYNNITLELKGVD